MDRVSVDRIRRVTFPASRRGYSKRAVHGFLDRLADWLETGRGDPARADLLRRELARVGSRAGAVLAEAELAAERLRRDAERDALTIVRRAREDADRIRADAREGSTRPSRPAHAQESSRR